jgi:hypothetical protein
MLSTVVSVLESTVLAPDSPDSGLPHSFTVSLVLFGIVLAMLSFTVISIISRQVQEDGAIAKPVNSGEKEANLNPVNRADSFIIETH